jgi:hypothetical protein
VSRHPSCHDNYDQPRPWKTQRQGVTSRGQFVPPLGVSPAGLTFSTSGSGPCGSLDLDPAAHGVRAAYSHLRWSGWDSTSKRPRHGHRAVDCFPTAENERAPCRPRGQQLMLKKQEENGLRRAVNGCVQPDGDAGTTSGRRSQSGISMRSARTRRWRGPSLIPSPSRPEQGRRLPCSPIGALIPGRDVELRAPVLLTQHMLRADAAVRSKCRSSRIRRSRVCAADRRY